jgi:hypothetical protein
MVSFINPVSAGAIDNGVEMVAQGIDSYMELKAEKNLQSNFGVTFGNTSDMDNLTPSQKLVYMIGAAEQHPLELDWVKKTFSTELVWYVIIGIIIILVLGCLEIIQRVCPEKVEGICNLFLGHGGNFDYSVLIIATLKLTLLPIFALPIIDFLITTEQTMSSGLMTSSLEFISFSADTTGIYIFESIAYAVCGWIFALRIQVINEFCAHVLIIILLLTIAWWNTKYFAVLFITWFVSALAMRPLVLFYSCKAVEHISSQRSTAMSIFVTPGTMTLVCILSFLTAVVFVLWPVVMLVVKIIMDYLLGAVFKSLRLYGVYKRIHP